MTDSKASKEPHTRSVNSQITDAVTQTNTMNIGLAPANSMATLYQTMAQSMGAALQNSVSNQQHVNTLNLAALSQNIQLILQPKARSQQPIHFSPVIIQPNFHSEAHSDDNDAEGAAPKSGRSKG
ncbi:MAG: RebB family R body protein [Sneathiella sp.]|nr:RebB family R body protein [Sneathiella sp.]